MKINTPFDTERLFVNNTEWNHFPANNLINEKNNKLTEVLSGFEKVSGIYVFWWTGKKKELEELNRKILLQGKKELDSFEWHPIEWKIDWLVPIKFDGKDHFALYVGKSTTLRNRIRQHFHFSLSHEEWTKHLQNPLNKKGKPKLEVLNGLGDHHNKDYFISYNPTTSCQFRAGMSLLCRDKAEGIFWNLVKQHITLSIFSNEKQDPSNEAKEKCFVAERFYLEDFLIGALRPWFNLDSER